MLRSTLILLFLWGFKLYSQTDDYPGNIINTLASPEFMGRGYTGKSDLKAAKFIRNELKKMDIQPAQKGNYFQYFKLNTNTFPGKMEVKLKDKLLVPGINYLIDPASSSLKGKFEVLYIKASDLNNKDIFRKLRESCQDKAILIDLNDTVKLKKDEEEAAGRIINAIKYDPDIRNILTIIFSDRKLTWGTSVWQAEKAVLILNSEGLDPLAIKEIDLNLKATFKKDNRTQNVIGLIPGTGCPDSFLVFTAHYDHLGMMGDKTCFPGANDNASGVAMMLNLCKHFSANPHHYSLLFIAFSAEESGLLGSKHFIENPVYEISKTKFLINFDLAGTGEEGIKVVNATVFKKEFELLKQINTENSLLPSVQPRGEACISDHCFFHRKGIPCFYIYTLGGISAYHDVFDKSETLPLTEFDDYFKLMVTFIDSL